MAAIEIELGPQSLAAIRELTDALRGEKADVGDVLLGMKEAAELLGVSRQTFWKWTREGNVPKGIRLSGRTIRWRKSDLLEFAKRRHAA